MDNRASSLFALIRGCKDSSGWRESGFGQRIALKCLISTVLLTGSMSAQSYQPTWESIDKRPTPAWFGDAKFGILFIGAPIRCRLTLQFCPESLCTQSGTGMR